jgi:hypothetical protein
VQAGSSYSPHKVNNIHLTSNYIHLHKSSTLSIPDNMSGTDFSDDYVAEMLAKDAKDSSIKYSALGVSAFLPTSK